MFIDLSGVVVREQCDDPKHPRRRSFFVKRVPCGATAHDMLTLPTLPRIGDEHPRCVTSGKPVVCMAITVEHVHPRMMFVRCGHEQENDLIAASATGTCGR
jgi:hypothetical protein